MKSGLLQFLFPGSSATGNQTIASIEGQLRATVPKPTPPAGLADDIMRAIRSRQPASAQRPRGSWRWLPAPAFAVAIVILAWGLADRPARTPDPEWLAARDALAAGQTLASNFPDALVSPLSREWVSLNQDLDRTTDFLLASLP